MDDDNGIKFSLGEAIRAIRVQRGWSPGQLAHAVHVHRSTVVRWESQTRQMREPYIREVAAALGVSPSFLYQVQEGQCVIQALKPFAAE